MPRHGSALRAAALGIFVATAGAGHARAAGFFITEMGTPDLGTAAAGRAALAVDATTAFGNPAGMARLGQSQLLVGIQPAYGISEFKRDSGTTTTGGDGGNAQGFLPGLGAYFVYSATPDLKFGLSLGSDFGGAVQYESSWAGRYYGTKAELLTLGAFPAASYRINDWFSVGVGAQVIYGRLNYKTAVANVTGGNDGQIQLKSNDVGAGGFAGILVEPAPGTRIGVTYTSQVDMDFKQKPDLSGGGEVFNALDPRISAAKVDLGLTVPQQVLLSGYQDVTDELAVVGSVNWQDWSQFGQPSLEIDSTTSRKATVNLNYKDTWGFGLGTRYKVAPGWLWMVGFAFDTSPMSKSQRTPALPLDRQYRIGTGIQYALSDVLTLGGAYEYWNLGNASLNRSRGPLAGTIQGEYSSNEVHFFNVTANWKF
jgi:long-chain fatty acid transport protein